MNPITYAGIGSRSIPDTHYTAIKALAQTLDNMGLHLRSGGATGTDQAFHQGALQGTNNVTLYLPWPGYNRHTGLNTRSLTPEQSVRAQSLIVEHNLHPAWHKCSPGARTLHARNMAILLGENLNQPVHLVIAYTENGQVKGGTGMAIRAARHYRIPVINLAYFPVQDWEPKITRYVSKQNIPTELTSDPKEKSHANT